MCAGGVGVEAIVLTGDCKHYATNEAKVNSTPTISSMYKSLLLHIAYLMALVKNLAYNVSIYELLLFQVVK